MRRLGERLPDARSGQVVMVSHCLLNQNVRYLGGAVQPGAVSDAVDGYVRAGVGLHQMPCPERHAWGGARKRWMLVAYGAGHTCRAPLVRLALPWFMAYTRLVYRRLARAVAADIVDYRRSGIDVVAIVGVKGSPSCGVLETLDMEGAVGALTGCPLAALDGRALNERVIEANTVPGRGLFVAALDRRLRRRDCVLSFAEHDLGPPPQIDA
jgi:uncharacterized protein YbbK (DUF523 family)